MKLTFIIAMLALLMWGCKKDSPAPVKNNPTGTNPTGTNPTSGGITITSVSPSSFYADQEMTITGTGFNPDKTKDTVFFGSIAEDEIDHSKKAFHPNTDGSQPNAGNTRIISATSTQLVVKVVDSSEMDFDAFYNLDTKKYPQGVGVYSNGKYVFTTINLIPIVQLKGLTDIEKQIQTVYYAYPGDTIKFLALGPLTPNGKVTIGTKQVSNYTLVTQPEASYFTENTITTLLAPDYFGVSNIDTATITVPITVTSASGREYTQKYTFWASPQMKVTSVKMDNNSFSLGGLKGSGGVVKIHVVGRYLKSDTYVEVTHSGKVSDSPLGVSGFPNTTDIEISPGDTGSYNVSIQRKSLDGKVTYYGGAQFTVSQ